MAFPEIVGLLVHGINGMFVIPFIALLLLIAVLHQGARSDCGL